MAYYTLITDIGRAKEANAKATGTALVLTHFAVGDGGGAAYNPAADQTALVNETHRVPINAIHVDDDNPTWLVVEAVLLATVGGWYVREAAVIDADGDLYAIVKYPETYKPILEEGVGKDLHLRVICETANTADITLKIDPAVVLATRSYVDGEIADHEAADDPHPQYATDADLSNHVAGRSHPAATETAQGMVELATDAEAVAGTDTTRAVTPAGLAALMAERGLVARVVDQKAEGTGGGSFTAGGWRIRELNTVAFDPHGLIGLASNQVTLQPGRYLLYATAPAANVNMHKARLYDVTHGAVIARGTTANSTMAAESDAVITESVIVHWLDLAEPTAFRIEHMCAETYVNGFGIPSGFDAEIYATLTITLIGA